MGARVSPWGEGCVESGPGYVQCDPTVVMVDDGTRDMQPSRWPRRRATRSAAATSPRSRRTSSSGC